MADPTRADDSEESSADELAGDVAFDPSAANVVNATAVGKSPAQRINEADADVREEDARQAKQNTLWRRLLFWGVAAIVVAVVIVDVIVILTYVTGGSVDPIVLSTFFAGSVAQVIGLLVIITRHLFPGAKA